MHITPEYLKAFEAMPAPPMVPGHIIKMHAKRRKRNRRRRRMARKSRRLNRA